MTNNDPRSAAWWNALPPRIGPKPQTTQSAPHEQLDQIAPSELQQAVGHHALSLPGVTSGPSSVSVPGSLAFFLPAELSSTESARPLGDEWGHLHPPYDGSLHLVVPVQLAQELIRAGWAEYHYLVFARVIPPTVVMVYGPRDDDELTIVRQIVDIAYAHARWGSEAPEHPRPW